MSTVTMGVHRHMGIFSKKSGREVVPVATELTESWFDKWAESVRAQMDDPPAAEWLVERAVGVIDHDCRDYVTKYCDRASLSAYVGYVSSGGATPWGLVSIAVGCNPKEGWSDFIVDDMKNKLSRFGEIVVDPSVAE